MKISVIRYNAGNIQSVLFALERLGVNAEVTEDFETITSSDKIIFPGVGEASSAMKYLQEKKLDQVIKNLTQPVLGICLGMQLMCAHSEENDTNCLGLFPSKVKRFAISTDNGIKVPQVGWNAIYNLKTGLFSNVNEGSYVYHVHSYYVPGDDYTIAETEYGIPYASAINRENFYGVQFHSEKSGTIGETILQNFLKIV